MFQDGPTKPDLVISIALQVIACSVSSHKPIGFELDHSSWYLDALASAGGDLESRVCLLSTCTYRELYLFTNMTLYRHSSSSFSTFFFLLHRCFSARAVSSARAHACAPCAINIERFCFVFLLLL